jgi:hypothetical protein
MEKENRVSVWIGTGVDIEAVDDFLTETYDDDGDSTCPLWDALGVDFLDHDLLEVDLQVGPVPLAELLDGLSYLPSFEESLLARGAELEIEEADALLVIYDFEPAAPKAAMGPGLRYAGTFDYSKDA